MITRVTQRMLTGQALGSIETASTRMAAAQEQMTTGRKLNRPSDSPSDTTVALKARSGIAEQQQYQRNAQDGVAWLSTTDNAIQSATSQMQRAYTLAVQGANTASNGTTAEGAIADEIDQIKQSMLGLANTQYLGRPVFGGTATGGAAFALSDPTDPTSAVSYVGDTGSVSRRVGTGTVVRVDTDGASVFGSTAGGSTDNVFAHLDALSTALRSTPTDTDGINTAITNLQSDMTRLSGAAANEGARMNQINGAVNVAQDSTLALQKVQSDVEDVDVAEATINMQTQTNAYQAALMAVSKTSQQSLLDFLS